MNAENPLTWIAGLVVLALVILPSAVALIGIYLHASGQDGRENLEHRKTGTEGEER